MVRINQMSYHGEKATGDQQTTTHQSGKVGHETTEMLDTWPQQ